MVRKQFQLQKELADDIESMGGDAFKILGFGLMSYRNVLKSLTITFILLTAIFYPIINLYRSGSGVNVENNPGKYSQYSIANLGYSSIQCATIPVIMEKLILQCPYGNITNIIPNGIGLNPHDGVKNVKMDACLVNQTTNGKCNPVLNLKNLEASFNKSCKGNTTCTLEMY